MKGRGSGLESIQYLKHPNRTHNNCSQATRPGSMVFRQQKPEHQSMNGAFSENVSIQDFEKINKSLIMQLRKSANEQFRRQKIDSI